MCISKRFPALAAVVFALSAIGAANASAAMFTYSGTGSLAGKATATQEFTFNAGAVKCSTAETSGTITSFAGTEQHIAVLYKGCTAFGAAVVHISPATYLLTANGEVHIKSPITMTMTAPFITCTFSIAAQTVKSVTYSNSGGNLVVTPNVSGITYTTSGGFCGAGGSNGTYKGTSEISRVGGGTVGWDP